MTAQPALRDAFMLSLSAASALFDLHAVNSQFERVPVSQAQKLKAKLLNANV